jgi:hypothetical protein
MTKLTVISLGAGVQSTTMALMAAHGEITPMPDCAIFADTGWEPAHVYKHLDWLETVLPFPVHRVSIGNIREALMRGHNKKGRRVAGAPWFILNANGSQGIGRRQCTKEYKIEPIIAKVRELLGIKPRFPGPKRIVAEQWIGISLDEAIRMKPSRVRYSEHRWPLIEHRMHRHDCLRWLERNGYPIPGKSACIGCPYHHNDQWRALSPAEFADAVEVDRAIRSHPGIRGQQFMHRSLKPLDQVDLSTAEDRGQLNLFLNECEGLCGV